MFIGGDSKSIRVLLDNGQVSGVPLEEAVAVEFSARTPAATPTPAPEPAAKPKPVQVPAGTRLNVRLVKGSMSMSRRRVRHSKPSSTIR